jgi:hypothetical protein
VPVAVPVKVEIVLAVGSFHARARRLVPMVCFSVDGNAWQRSPSSSRRSQNLSYTVSKNALVDLDPDRCGHGARLLAPLRTQRSGGPRKHRTRSLTAHKSRTLGICAVDARTESNEEVSVEGISVEGVPSSRGRS